MRCRQCGFRRWLELAVVCLLLGCSASAQAQVSAGYSEYYIPGDEGIMYLIFDTLDAGTIASSNMHAVINVTSWSATTTVYYDHWEDGYDFDPTNPAATADERVSLATPGAQMTFESASIPLPTTAMVSCSPAGTCYYDGGDRIYAAGGAVTVTRASWIDVTGVGNQAVAWEIYPVKPQLTTYILPFGEDLALTDFSRVFALVQATADDTSVTVDFNGDATPDTIDWNRNGSLVDDGTSYTLQQGNTLLIDQVSMALTSEVTLNAGTVIKGDKTLQLKYVSGQVRTPPGWMARGFSAFPRGYWTKDYYAPLDQPTNGGVGNTDYYLYNPNAGTITVDWQSRAGNGSFTIAAGAVRSFRAATGGAVPTDSGLYFKGSDVFWGVGVGDAANYVREWGYSLLPSTMLFSEHFLGWAPGGIDPTPPLPAGDYDDSGIFLTVAQDNTRVFVDLDNNGSADQTYTLDRLQTQFIYDPVDGDLSQAHFWATGPFTMSYGQNSDQSPQQAPAIDLGYVAIPGTDFISLVLTVDKSVSPQVVSTAAATPATFTIAVSSQKYTVDGVAVSDTLPPDWQYVAGTTTITRPDMSQVTGAGADPAVTGSGTAADPFVLSWDSVQAGGEMAENQQIVISFTAQTTALLAAGTLSRNRVEAVGTRTVAAETQTFAATDFAYVVSGDFTITKTSDAPVPAYPGDRFTYTATVANPVGGAGINRVTLYDALPAGVSSVAGTTTLSRSTVADTFGTVAYTNNNGTRSWAGAWGESDIHAAAGAGAGFVLVTGGALQLRYQASNYRDDFTTNVYTRNDGTNTWSAPWSETGDDGTAAGGTITVDAANNNRVNFGPGAAGRAITRTAAVSGGTVTVGFTLSDQGIDAGEGVIAEYDLGLGAGWQFIQQINNNILTGVNPLPVDTAGATSITLRFTTFGTYAAGDNAGVDAVNIAIGNAIGSGIRRAVDLSGATSAALSLNYAAANLETGDTVEILASSDGVSFTALESLDGPTGAGTRIYDLAAPTNYLSATTTVLIRVANGFDATNETFSVDNLSVTFDQSVTGPDPPDLVPMEYCYALTAGQSLTATFEVTVDNPLPSGVTAVTNTAAATCALYPIQITASVTDTLANPSALSASLAGRVWFDADGGADQDVGEPGIANAEVTLKDQWGAPIATTLTDANGRYIFTGVTPANGYYAEATDGLPLGVTQSYPAGRSDNRTAGVDLSAGESETGADLGFRTSGATATFGDQVWVDADDDGVRDAGEIGLAGVTVTLYRDNNGDGVVDGGDSNLGSTSTAAAGTYLFTGLAAGGGEDYLVVAATPAGYLPTGATQFRTVDAGGGTAYLNADFGYRGDTVTTYAVKDRVWKDANADGSYDSASEFGFPGVTVELLDASLNVIGSATTGADGTFTFSGLAGGGADYSVRVNDTAGSLADYYGTTSYALALLRAESNLTASVDHTTASPFGSFGFNTSRSVGDTIFNDLDGDWVQETGESGLGGVSAQVYRDDGDGVFEPGAGAGLDGNPLGSVMTDVAGQYLFSGLADGVYFVSVTAPTGYSFTEPGGDYDGVGGNGIQKIATIAGGANVMTVDYPFQATTPRSVSGTIWEDLDADGIAPPTDGAETGVNGVVVDVYLDSDNDGTLDAGEPLVGSVVTATDLTGNHGTYSFPGLGSARYIMRVNDPSMILAGYDATYEKTEGVTSAVNGWEAVNLAAGDVTDVNFGYKKPKPTYAAIAFLRAFVEDGAVIVEWRTSLEAGTVGFHLLRRDAAAGEFVRLNDALLPGLIVHPQGGTYRFLDDEAPLRGNLVYKLSEVEFSGTVREYGPFTVSLPGSKAARDVGRGLSSERRTRKTFERLAADVSGARRERHRVRSAERKLAAQVKAARSGSAVKITTSEEGLHYLAADTIAVLLGIDARRAATLIENNRLRLTGRGALVPYLPAAGGVGLYFHAEPLESIYSGENVYWLSSGKGSTVGAAAPGTPGPQPAFFAESLHVEEQHYQLPASFDDPEADFWCWDYVFAGYPGLDAKNFTVRAPAVAGVGSATLRVRLIGGSDTGAPLDHHAVIRWNGVQVGEARWDGPTGRELTIALDPAAVLEGDNSLELTGLLDPGVAWSIVYLDSVDLSYQRLLRAEGDELAFVAPAASTVGVGGFSSPGILLLDITNPGKPTLVTQAAVGASADGTYQILFSVPAGTGGKRYLATAYGKARAPAAVSAYRDAGLRNRTNAADYVLIAPDSLHDAAQALASYRSGRGLLTLVVDLEAIYDEFNGGIASPHAIREFLRYATGSWRTPPHYAALVGRGTYDYQDFRGFGDNLVPPLLAATDYGLVVSDSRISDLAGEDGIPEIALGRLPVVTSQDLLDYLAKIRAHEAAAVNPRRVLLTADDPDDGGAFTRDSDAVATLVPADHQVDKIYLTTCGAAAGKQAIVNAVNGGVLLFNYIGHGGFDRLAQENLFSNADVPLLTNAGQLPVFLAMTCSVGNFGLPGYASLAETLLLSKTGGTLASWAPSGLSENTGAMLLDEAFFRATFVGGRTVLGDIVWDALSDFAGRGGAPGMKYLYNLIGEPVSELP